MVQFNLTRKARYNLVEIRIPKKFFDRIYMITPVSELNDINFYGVTLQDVDDTSLLKGGEGEYTYL